MLQDSAHEHSLFRQPWQSMQSGSVNIHRVLPGHSSLFDNHHRILRRRAAVMRDIQKGIRDRRWIETISSTGGAGRYVDRREASRSITDGSWQASRVPPSAPSESWCVDRPFFDPQHQKRLTGASRGYAELRPDAIEYVLLSRHVGNNRWF